MVVAQPAAPSGTNILVQCKADALYQYSCQDIQLLADGKWSTTTFDLHHTSPMSRLRSKQGIHTFSKRQHEHRAAAKYRRGHVD